MNIFYLDDNAKTCAQMHNDKHVVKMILEYAQLLSSAHRVIDGTMVVGLSKTGRKQKRYELTDDRDAVLYKATHINHPSAKWARHCNANYQWLFKMWSHLLDEYQHRYGKEHSSSRLLSHLKYSPINISTAYEYSAPWRAMPEEFKVARTVSNYTIESYRAYYIGAKAKMCRWTNRPMPEWFAQGINKLYEDTCYIQYDKKRDRIISMPLQYANI